MSTKDQVSKRKETYRAAIKKVKKDQELYDAFRKLNSAIPQRKQKTPMSQEDLNKMDTAYRATLNTLNKKMEDLSKKIDKAPSANKKQINSKKKLEDKYEYYTKLRKTLSKDLKAVTACRKLQLEPLPNVTQFYENARSDKAEYDLRKAKKYGAGTSTRYRINTPEKDGFFTISKKGISDTQKKMNALNEIDKKYGNKSIFSTHNKLDMMKLAETLLKNDEIDDKIHDKFEEYVTRANFRSTRREVKEEFINAINESDSLTDNKKKMLTDIISDIKPGEMLSLLEYMHDAHKIENVADINKAIGVNTNAKQDKRNSAMSMVADLLGRKDLIASSTTLQIKDPETGKIINGTLMENAKGIDRDSTKKEDLEKFNQLTPEKIQNSLQLKKDIADMQILDWLCGNADRHFRNIFYKFDNEGNICGLVGIDNDLSFGKEDHASNLDGINLENMNVMTEEMADKIMNMNKEEFRNMLFGYDLTTAEVNKSLERLETLQEKITMDREYFKDMPPGYVEDNRIRIMNDEQLATTSFYGDLAGGRKKLSYDAEPQGREDKNLFASVSKHGINANGIDYSITAANAGIYEDNVNVIRESVLIDKRIDDMEASERKTRNGHQPFRDMITAMKNCKDAYSFIENGMAKPTYDGGVKVSEDNINLYKSTLEEALKKCDAYMETKDVKKIMKLSKTSNGYERYMLAKESKEGIKKTLEHLNGMIEKKNLVEDYQIRYEGHKVLCDKQLQNINDKDATRKAALADQAKEVNKNRALQNNAPAMHK